MTKPPEHQKSTDPGPRIEPEPDPERMGLPEACATCPAGPARLERAGISAGKWDYLVALAGNPNTGKSTVFNALTGLRQHTGNWPGKTVTRAEGAFGYAGKRYKIVDLPGTYSLLARSTDEEVARDFLLFGQPDVSVIVVDASRLERNLNLVLQVLAITDRSVVCLNLMDEARRHGLEVDPRRLARDLGVPVVPMVARQGEGLEQLLAALHGVASGEIHCRPRRVPAGAPELEAAVAELVAGLEAAFPGLANARWVALRLLDGDPSIVEAVRDGSLGRTLSEPARAGA
jgi:ferrous iron transport protein B